MPVAAGASKDAADCEESTGVDAHGRIAFRSDRKARLSSTEGCAALVKLATRLIVEVALEAESRAALVRDYCEHGARAGQGWRNGVSTGSPEDGEGFVDYSAPQIVGREEPLCSENRETLKAAPRRWRTWRWSFWLAA